MSIRCVLCVGAQTQQLFGQRINDKKKTSFQLISAALLVITFQTDADNMGGLGGGKRNAYKRHADGCTGCVC